MSKKNSENNKLSSLVFGLSFKPFSKNSKENYLLLSLFFLV